MVLRSFRAEGFFSTLGVPDWVQPGWITPWGFQFYVWVPDSVRLNLKHLPEDFYFCTSCLFTFPQYLLVSRLIQIIISITLFPLLCNILMFWLFNYFSGERFICHGPVLRVTWTVNQCQQAKLFSLPFRWIQINPIITSGSPSLTEFQFCSTVQRDLNLDGLKLNSLLHEK